MENCCYCKSSIQSGAVCAHCGKIIYTAGGQIIYGKTIKDIVDCEVTITDKYLIIRKVSKAEVRGTRMGNAGGLVGAIIAEAAKSPEEKPHGFYLLSNIAKGIYPYRASGIRRNNAIKLINKDSTDFILIFDKPGFIDGTAKVLKKMVANIRNAVPVFEDGSRLNFGAVLCATPYVTFNTLDKIKAIPIASAQPAPTPEPAPASTPTPNPAPKPATASVPNQPPQPIITPEPKNHSKDTTTTPTKIRCVRCGNFVFADRNFCNKCGTKIVHEKRCIRCGKLLEEEDIYCSYCGYKV